MSKIVISMDILGKFVIRYANDWAVENYKTLMAEYLQGKDAKGRSCDNIEYFCYLLCRQIVQYIFHVQHCLVLICMYIGPIPVKKCQK
jgi:hypothetical protein